MQTGTLIREIERLPIASRFHVMEQTLKSIKKEEAKRQAEIQKKRPCIIVKEICNKHNFL
jgi:hypothetical protein